MKEYIALNQSKNSKQAESKKKVLQKMERAGLTKKPEQEKALNFKFSDPGHLPPRKWYPFFYFIIGVNLF
jgi:ATP-binding cassette subfamily F protein 2